jgi:hypothetical protein
MSTPKEVYIRYYRQQRQSGGQLPVFRGSRHEQDGAGLGDILRTIFRVAAPMARRVAPVLLKGATTFARSAIRAHREGVPVGEALKQAVGPAVSDASNVAFQQFGGRRKRAATKRKTASLAGGGDGVGAAKKRRRTATKRRKPQAGGKAKRRPRTAKKATGGGKVYKRRAGKQKGGRKRKATTKKLIF